MEEHNKAFEELIRRPISSNVAGGKIVRNDARDEVRHHIAVYNDLVDALTQAVTIEQAPALRKRA